jgi:hypothetical protein
MQPLLFLATLLFLSSAYGNELLQQAKDHLKNQEQEKAFQVFLSSLETGETQSTPTAEEQTLYDQALNLYLDHTDPQQNSLKIVQEYAPVIKKHPDFHLLTFLVAASAANAGAYEQFFDLFHPAYRANPHHFLAYKTLAVIHIKLFEKARTPEERERQRQKILDNIAKAIDRYPSDTSLYKMQIGFADGPQKAQIVSDSLNKIISGNIIVPRVDIPIYVHKAVETKQYDLAQKFIDKAKEWYKLSKLLTGAQEYLDRHKTTE